MRVSVWMVVLLSISAPGGGDGRRYERVERSGGRSDAGRGDATSTRLCRPTSGTRLSNLHPAQGGRKIFLKLPLNIFQDVLNI